MFYSLLLRYLIALISCLEKKRHGLTQLSNAPQHCARQLPQVGCPPSGFQLKIFYKFYLFSSTFVLIVLNDLIFKLKASKLDLYESPANEQGLLLRDLRSTHKAIVDSESFHLHLASENP